MAEPVPVMPEVMPEVILFEHPNFQGDHKHIFEPGEADLNGPFDKRFANKTSSIVVKGTRTWLIYPKQNHTGGAREVGPGRWKTTEAAHKDLKDNQVQSLQPKP